MIVQTVVRTLVDLLAARASTHPDRGYRFLGTGTAISASLSYRELDTAARTIAVAVAERGIVPGTRAILAYPPGLDFISAFWGCVYAGVTAVPVPAAHAARLQRTLPRLRAIAEDCGAGVVLTSSALVRDVPALAPELDAVTLVTTDDLTADPSTWRPPEITAADLAVLQYTSGSTSAPRGVMLSHGNLLHNLAMLREFHLEQEHMVMLHWLPLYHDMGLIRGMLSPLEMGGDCLMMSPLAFVERPLRWLAALTAHRATTTGAPNFGFELCVRKIADADLADLDLSALRLAFCSAEPIRKPTIDRFLARFAACGLDPVAFRPAYGLAEATVMVSGERGAGHRVHRISERELRGGRIAAPADDADAYDLVSCGQPLGGQEVVIVDEAGHLAAPDRVGEIWIRGGSVGLGYWNKPDDTAHAFDARLADGTGPFLRTGDLGWRSPAGDLCITGRSKDVIIIRGQTYYPQDIEAAIEAAATSLRAGCSAAFAVERDGAEAVAVICECDPRALAGSELVAAIRAAGGEQLELSIDAIVVVAPGQVPKTASGKVQRARARELYLGGRLAPLHAWERPPR